MHGTLSITVVYLQCSHVIFMVLRNFIKFTVKKLATGLPAKKRLKITVIFYSVRRLSGRCTVQQEQHMWIRMSWLVNSVQQKAEHHGVVDSN
jgi:hypothetical protein